MIKWKIWLFIFCFMFVCKQPFIKRVYKKGKINDFDHGSDYRPVGVQNKYKIDFYTFWPTQTPLLEI